jgi:endonuclease/exonuclease/phosphatase family metal-dependent hydrolase
MEVIMSITKISIIPMLAFFIGNSMIADPLVCPKNNTIKVGTFNVRRKGKERKDIRKWDTRKHNVMSALKNLQADIIALQEPLEEQIKDIATSLTSKFAWVGQGRGKAWCGLSKSEFTPIFYNKERFALVKSGTFSVSPGTKVMWKWKKYGKLPRIATWVLLRDNCSGKELYVYNTHLDHEYEAVQKLGIVNLTNHIKAEVPADKTVIILGDFNTDSELFLASMLAKYGFTDAKGKAKKVTGPKQTTNSWSKEKVVKTVVDHIFVKAADKGNVNIAEYEVVPSDLETVSDHRPVTATMNIE